jgi:metal-responsive CopG/Arc/MetJ family transcriptional regulator
MTSMAKKILVEVPDDLAEALDRLREKEGETRLTIIRMLLKEALTARKAWPPKGSRKFGAKLESKEGR